MEMEEVFKAGCLFVPPQTFLRKSWSKKFCSLYNSSNHGIQRLELFDNEVKQNPSKIIPLTDCVKVTVAPQKQQPNVFEVRTKSTSYLFSVDSFQEMTDWLAAFQAVAFGSPSSVFASNNSVQLSKDSKQEENLLYSSMDEPEVFAVTALNTSALLRNGLQGDYNLIVTSVNLSVAEECSQGRIGRILFTWPYRHIRRYGCSNSNFSFEAGRKCASGEGLFTFSTNDGTQIFQSVDAHVAVLKSSHGDMDIPASPSISDEKDSFFASKDSQSLFPDCAQNERHSDSSDFSLVSQFQTNTHTMNFINKPQIPPLPLQKPPRKSKSLSKADTSKDSNVLFTSDLINRNSGIASNVYEELQAKDKCNQRYSLSTSTSKSVYENAEKCRSNAVNVLTLTDELKHIMNCNPEKFSMADNLNENLNVQTISKGSPDCHYDRLLLKTSQPALRSFTSGAPDHIYGKLLAKQPASPKKVLSNTYDSVQLKKSVIQSDSSPSYSNVQLPKAFPLNAIDDEREKSPDHFLKNDAEYAQILKRNEN